MSRAAVWTGVTASQALFSLTVRHTPARGAWMRTEHRRDVKGERGAERRPRSARAGPGARVSARCPCEPARSVDTRGRRRADTSGPWTGARAGPERGCPHGVHGAGARRGHSRTARWESRQRHEWSVDTVEADGRELSAGRERRDPSRLASVALKFKPKRVLSSQCLRVQAKKRTL